MPLSDIALASLGHMGQIAEVLHVTESRVSQIRTQALKRLRQRMSPSEDVA